MVTCKLMWLVLPWSMLFLMFSTGSASALTRELEYSDWYLLKLSPEEGNITTTKENLDDGTAVNLSSALLSSLATKLSVSPKVFKVNQFTVDSTTSTISANLSVRWRGLGPSTHSRLASLQLTSPTFPLPNRPYTLALLLHAKKQHLYLPSPSLNPHSLGLLLSLLLGGLGVFLLLLAASFLLVLVLGGSRDHHETEQVDQETLLEEEDENEEEKDRPRGKGTMMLNHIGSLYQRVVHSHDNMISIT